MDDELVCSANSLKDLIDWSKNGHVIILTGRSTEFYCRPEYKTSDKFVQIIFSSQWKCLMDEGEWPWYLIQSGCVKMTIDEFPESKIANRKIFRL